MSSATATSSHPQGEPEASEATTAVALEDTGNAIKYCASPKSNTISNAARNLLLALAASTCLSTTAPIIARYRRREEDSATSMREDAGRDVELIARDVVAALCRARDESFEDGMDGHLWRWLDLNFADRRSDLATALASLVVGGTVPPEPWAMALRWLSDVKQVESHAALLWLFERSLFSHDATVRDGAVVALQNLEEPAAIAALESAARRETVDILKREMEKVGTQLQRRHALSPS